jgi:hypothetical protein
MQENPCGKCCVGNVIYDKGGKTIGRETMDAEINNVTYMELYSGPKMAHDKYDKTNAARSIGRDSTVLVKQPTAASNYDPNFKPF